MIEGFVVLGPGGPAPMLRFLLALFFVCPSLVAADEPKTSVPKELAPKLVTLKSDRIRLREALQQLAKQTDITVEDRRRKEEADDPELKLNLANVTFWQALDAIAKEADLRVSLYQRDGKIALVDGPHIQLPVSYSGLFRCVVRRITTVHDLETDLHFSIANLEIAWEPHFRPLFMESRPQGLVVKDDKQKDLTVEEQGGGRLPITGGNAAVVELHLPAPPRNVARLGLIKGTLGLVGSTKMLTFEFDTLAKEKAAKEAKQTQEGVTVRLSKIDLSEKTHWTVVVSLDYPSNGPKFESFQSWVVNNEIQLHRTVGQDKVSNNGYSLDSLGSNKAVITYYFTEQMKKKFGGGKPEEWKVVYRAPAPFTEVSVPFEFKDVPLP
jgi:hypothetical protein